MSPEQWVEFVTEFGEKDSIIREGADHLRQALADRDRLAAELARVRPLLEEITDDLEQFESPDTLAIAPRTCEAIREFCARSRAALAQPQDGQA